MARWTSQQTLLLVGEGATEVAFLRHVKSLYVSRGWGLSVAIKDAHGKGAKHVIDWTSRQIGDYSKKAAMVDTDQDWSDAVQKKANASKITVLKSEPQIEALLLRILGESDVGDAVQLKKRLKKIMNRDLLNQDDYSNHFDRDRLEECRHREPTIDVLLDLLGSKKGSC